MRSGAAVVISVGGLARRLNINLVAEGVEDEGHERFLLDHSYTLAQGYHYARPMPSEAFTKHLAAKANGR